MPDIRPRMWLRMVVAVNVIREMLPVTERVFSTPTGFLLIQTACTVSTLWRLAFEIGYEAGMKV